MTVLRVERGDAGPEEVAAITAVLLARAAAGPRDPGERAPRRPARAWRTAAFRAPHSWRS
jgi:hypothetical protein